MNKEILVAGIYLADQKNNIQNIIKEFNRSSDFKVVQRWAKLGKSEIKDSLKEFTILDVQEKIPKFVILNKLLSREDINKYEFIIISDDDIELPHNFIDNYLEIVDKYKLSLAQPARTHDSYIDHFIVEQLDGLIARKTRFVEIGPVFSIRNDLFKHLLPFDEENGMGWGYDFVWPCIVENLGMNMGIVDALPVEHKLRPPVTHYNHKEADNDLEKYIKKRKHLLRSEAFKILESYA